MNNMMRKILTAFLGLAVVGCGGTTSSEETNTPEPTPPVVTEYEPAGSFCLNGGTKVTLTNNGVSSVFYVCNGPAGPAGMSGADGVNGANGQDGRDGQPGQDGQMGAQGPAGLDGQAGPQGPAGPQGISGVDGQAGPTGPAGASGALISQETLPTGNAHCPYGGTALTFGGSTAPVYVCNGSPGQTSTIVGAVGVQGHPGANGLTPILSTATEPAGENCAAGGVKLSFTTGDVVVSSFVCNGRDGAAGEKGDQGIQGEKGDQGIQGEKGDQGIQGETGSVGPQGIAGPAGATGATGEKGDQGIQGEKGEMGSVGPAGAAGPAGADGSNVTVKSVISCAGTYSNGKRFVYKASVYSNDLIFATATVEINSNSASGFNLLGTNDASYSTAPVEIFSSNGGFYRIGANRTTSTIAFQEVNSSNVVTTVATTNTVCTTASF